MPATPCFVLPNDVCVKEALNVVGGCHEHFTKDWLLTFTSGVDLENVAQKWEPVLGNNMRKNKDLERSSDSIRTQSALAPYDLPPKTKCPGVESNGVASDNLESDYRQVYVLSGFFQGDCKHANGGTDPGRSVNSKTALPPSPPGLAISMLGLVSRPKSKPGSQASAGISHYLNFSETLVS
jgi:hypothetical protein